MQSSHIAVEENQITDAKRWNLLQQKAQLVRIVRAYRLFREQGIEPILIKGYAAARYYPPDHVRLSLDIDFAVASADFDSATRLTESSRSEGLAIDIHRELRHLDTLPWNDLFENSQLVTIDGIAIRVLRAEDHLRVVSTHWLTDGGANRERLWDIYYMLQNRGADFDWDRFLNHVGKRRRRWMVCTVGLAHRYLGLDIHDTPLKKEALDLPGWLTTSVETEWSRETPNVPLEVTLRKPKVMARQLLNRIRPNPIGATVLMNGSFDARTRVIYQIGNLASRVPATLRRIYNTIRLGSK